MVKPGEVLHLDGFLAWPLVLSTLAGCSTSLGAAIAVVRKPGQWEMSYMLGLAIGVMATVSIVELLVKNALENNALLVCASTIMGGLAYYLLEPLVPRMEAEEGHQKASKLDAEEKESCATHVGESHFPFVSDSDPVNPKSSVAQRKKTPSGKHSSSNLELDIWCAASSPGLAGTGMAGGTAPDGVVTSPRIREDPRPGALPSARPPAFGGVLLPAHNEASGTHSFSDAAFVSPHAATPTTAPAEHPLGSHNLYSTNNARAHVLQGLPVGSLTQPGLGHAAQAHQYHHLQQHPYYQQYELQGASTAHSLPPHNATLSATNKRSSHNQYNEPPPPSRVTTITNTNNTATKHSHLHTHHQRRSFLRLGVLMCVTMTAHNMPEGFAVAFSAYTHFGPLMAAAIALHNIPEGIIIAAPIFAATGSRWWALGWATASGLSEPLGALLALLVLHPFITPERLQYLLAAVGGLMLAVCGIELWPEGKACKHDRGLYTGILAGIIVMGWTLSVE